MCGPGSGWSGITMCNKCMVLCYSNSKQVDISDGFAILSDRRKKGPRLAGAFVNHQASQERWHDH